MHQPIVFASRNEGKWREIAPAFAAAGVEIILQSRLGVNEIEEIAPTFVENALHKARHAAGATGLPAVADDSGLCVDALDGAPGVYSARYAGGASTDQTNREKLLHAMVNVPARQRTAFFYCVMVYLSRADDPRPLITEGVWRGRILFAPRGEAGFGYDPIFWVPAHRCAAAELPLAVKNRLSHRGQALARLLRRLRSLFGVSFRMSDTISKPTPK